MKEEQCIVITLPECLSHVPVEIIRSSKSKGIVLDIAEKDGSEFVSNHTKEYAFIWRQSDYLKIRLDEILWIEASVSYSKIHLVNNRSMVISFHLAVIEKNLPGNDFVRIHRSHIVNLRHVTSLIGNSLNVKGHLLTIGREYRDDFHNRFVFLGIRQKGKA